MTRWPRASAVALAAVLLAGPAVAIRREPEDGRQQNPSPTVPSSTD